MIPEPQDLQNAQVSMSRNEEERYEKALYEAGQVAKEWEDTLILDRD